MRLRCLCLECVLNDHPEASVCSWPDNLTFRRPREDQVQTPVHGRCRRKRALFRLRDQSRIQNELVRFHALFGLLQCCDTSGTPKSGQLTAAITRGPFDVAHVKKEGTWMQMSSSVPMAAKQAQPLQLSATLCATCGDLVWSASPVSRVTRVPVRPSELTERARGQSRSLATAPSPTSVRQSWTRATSTSTQVEPPPPTETRWAVAVEKSAHAPTRPPRGAPHGSTAS